MENAAGIGQVLLETVEITKTFPGLVALDSVDFTLHEGEVHALFGENGAGKSTLINIIAGTFAPTAGEMRFRGEPLADLSPHRARHIGISPVFQEFSLIPDLTVEQNLFLGHERSRYGVLDRAGMRREALRVIGQLGFSLAPGRKVRELSRAHQQMVEIAKAMLTDVRLLILDEPTASLTEAEAARLFDLVAEVKARGVGVIYVSHRMAEIRRLADRITVLRDGRKIATVRTQDVTDQALIELMTGRRAGALYPDIARRPGEVAFATEHLTLANGSVRDASIEVRRGEVVGVAGLVGCGKSELLRAAFGLEKIASGTIRLNGQKLTAPNPKRALAAGLCYFPSDRVAEGLALSRPVRENVSMAALDRSEFARATVLRRSAERSAVQRIVDTLRLRPARIEQAVIDFSGGNRQKIVLARAMTRDVDVFLFDEPTVGIDVGAKEEVYQVIKELAERGAAILVVSSELPEVMSLSHRLYVMYQGRIVAHLQEAAINEADVLSHFFGQAAHAA